MDNTRLELAELKNTNLQLLKEVNDLRLECIKLLADTKVERSDKIYTATELKKVKFSGGLGDRALNEMIKAGLPQFVPYEGAQARYSDKAVDEWIASKSNQGR